MPRHSNTLLATLTICTLTAVAWEDPVSDPPTRQPEPTPRETSSRRQIQGTHIHSQYLDEEISPAFTFGLTYYSEADVEERASFSQFDADFDLRLGYYADLLGGDVDTGILFRSLFFSGSANADIPDYLIELALDFGWTWQLNERAGFQLRCAPGIYADCSGFAADMFAFPTATTFYYSINPQLALKLGALERYGWETPVIPDLGLVWAPAEPLRLELGFPQTRLDLYARGFSLHAAATWDSRTYHLEEGDDDPDSLTITETRLFGGGEMQLSDSLRLLADIGMALSREFKTEGSDDPNENHAYNVDDSLFFRLALIGPF